MNPELRPGSDAWHDLVAHRDECEIRAEEAEARLAHVVALCDFEAVAWGHTAASARFKAIRAAATGDTRC